MEISFGDIVAVAALLLSGFSLWKNYTLTARIHNEQQAWQRSQEEKRARELEESLTPNIQIVTDHRLVAGPSLLAFYGTDGKFTKEDAYYLAIIARNHGQAVVNLERVYILLDSSTPINYMDKMPDINGSLTSFPHELRPGSSASAYWPMEHLLDYLKSQGLDGEVSLVGVFEDSLGNIYKSEPYQVDTSQNWSSKFAP